VTDAEKAAEARLGSALSAARSVQAEVPGPFTPEHERAVAAYVAGDVSAAELYRCEVARFTRGKKSCDDPEREVR
jgi:hypothetical protein